MQEERVRAISHNKEECGDVLAYAVQAGIRNSTKDKNVSSTHCHRSGHYSNSCFQIIGYPNWWGECPRGIGKGIGREKSTQLGKGRGIVKAHAAQANSSTGILDYGPSDVKGITTAQWDTLVSLLNNIKVGATDKLSGKCTSLPWILDTGASHHMTGTLACLTNIKDIMGCSVGLPNGQHTTTTKEDNVLLSDTLTLTNVLYVPSLNCNLVSVSQLVNESNRVIAFSDKFCVIQDHTTRTLIGMGEQREGLYYLGKMVTATAM